MANINPSNHHLLAKDSPRNCFSLRPNCLLVKGAKRGAIYNLAAGDVYSIDEDATKVIELLEEGSTIAEVLARLPNLAPEEILRYLNSLREVGLGLFISNGNKIPKMVIEPPTMLEFFWLEVTSGCNLSCIHCYNKSLPKLLGKEKVKTGVWVRVLGEARALGCKKIQFTGGEPLLFDKDLFSLINKSRSLGYEFIEVFTNATLITDEHINLLASEDVAVAVSFYCSHEKIHEQITLVRGSYQKTLKAIKKLKEKDVRLRVGIIVMRINEDFLEETINFLKTEAGVEKIGYDIIRQAGRGQNPEIQPTKSLSKQKINSPRFPKYSLETFRRMVYGHQCFSGSICVSADGNVHPCIMEKDIVMGNVIDQSLEQILNDSEAQKIRGLSKDHVEICKLCEYRYCCFDCRLKAKSLLKNPNFYAKPNQCPYNPETGTWENNN